MQNHHPADAGNEPVTEKVGTCDFPEHWISKNKASLMSFLVDLEGQAPAKLKPGDAHPNPRESESKPGIEMPYPEPCLQFWSVTLTNRLHLPARPWLTPRGSPLPQTPRAASGASRAPRASFRRSLISSSRRLSRGAQAPSRATEEPRELPPSLRSAAGGGGSSGGSRLGTGKK